MKYSLYTQDGTEKGSVTLPERLFSVPWNNTVVHNVVYAMEANARQSTANTKGRGEVRGGGKRPWKQKGTGRARHSSIRSPLWVGGGITHGPRVEKNYQKKINKKVAAKALMMALSGKARDNELLCVENLAVAPKTKNAQDVIAKWGAIKGFDSLTKKRTNAALIAVPKKTPELKRAFSNVSNVRVEEVRNLNVVDVLRYRHLVLVSPDESFAVLEKKPVTLKK